jgi:hypothetical protein
MQGTEKILIFKCRKINNLPYNYSEKPIKDQLKIWKRTVGYECWYGCKTKRPHWILHEEAFSVKRRKVCELKREEKLRIEFLM